ncbi:AraC family transcriptional regulator [Dethiothermospora halolimnae]|uniref:AraC family transcriptional regulator n=1 Tax=Dethiothermospora halolimnae TaxID=3114390 RepID=UPI003CCC3969
MSWIKNMNNALDYIEENIKKDIKSEDVAKVAYASKYHFLRIFNALTGITLGEYIRQRRLSLAAKEVVDNNKKIIDIAYDYGYETPEAFSKAFKRLHKITPSQARKMGKKLKAIPPMSFQITVKGESRMDYKIVKKEGFKVVGVSRHYTTKNGENFREIPKFWCEMHENGIVEKLEKEVSDLGILGVCYNYNEEQEEFDYMIAREGDKIEDLEDYDVVDVPSCTFAIFESIGPIPEAIQKITKKIYAEWFPATGYEHAKGPELEVYLPGNMDAEDYKCEVWIPIVDK